MQHARDDYDRAEYIRDMGFCHTANWSLHQRVIDPLESFMAAWGGVDNLETYFAQLFEIVNASIQDVEVMVGTGNCKCVRKRRFFFYVKGVLNKYFSGNCYDYTVTYLHCLDFNRNFIIKRMHCISLSILGIT